MPHTSEEAGVRRGMPGRNFHYRMSSAWVVSCILSTSLSYRPTSCCIDLHQGRPQPYVPSTTGATHCRLVHDRTGSLDRWSDAEGLQCLELVMEHPDINGQQTFHGSALRLAPRRRAGEIHSSKDDGNITNQMDLDLIGGPRPVHTSIPTHYKWHAFHGRTCD